MDISAEIKPNLLSFPYGHRFNARDRKSTSLGGRSIKKGMQRICRPQ
jgi:hypothetical protein